VPFGWGISTTQRGYEAGSHGKLLLFFLLLIAGCSNEVSRAIRNLQDPSPQVRREAAALLGTTRDSRSVEPLIKALGDPDVKVRRTAAEALGAIGDPRAIEPLSALLGDQSPPPDDEKPPTDFESRFELTVRAAAARALVKFGDAGASALVAVLSDRQKPGWARSSAAYGAGLMKDQRAIPTLIDAVLSDEHTLAPEAARALGKIGSPAVPALLAAMRQEGREGAEWNRGRSRLARALGLTKDDSAVTAALAMARESNPRIRQMGVVALGFAADPRGVEPLLRALSEPDFSEDAKQGLIRIGAPAVPKLIETLRRADDYTRANATYTLGGMSAADALAPLKSLLEDRNDGVARSSSRALASMAEIGRDSAAIAVLEEGWQREDLRLIAGGADYFVERKPGGEDLIIAALRRFGDDQTAFNLLNCGNQKLEQAARQWAAAHGFRVEPLRPDSIEYKPPPEN
jgi:HEAT repeat protein